MFLIDGIVDAMVTTALSPPGLITLAIPWHEIAIVEAGPAG